MKILILSALYPPHSRGGGEISTSLIAEALAARGHEVVVLTGTTTAAPGAHTETRQGVVVRREPLPFGAKPLFEQRHARKLARRVRHLLPELSSYDIIHAHDFRSALLVAELLALQVIRREQAVVTARDYAQLCGSPNNLMADGTVCVDGAQLRCIIYNQAVVEAPLMRKPFRIWQYWYNIQYRRHAFLAIPKQVFISHAQKKEIARLQDLTNQVTSVIYNPVTPVAETSTHRPTQERIVYIGTMQTYKGVGLLLAAFQTLLASRPNAHLLLIGDGANRTAYEEEVSRSSLQYRVTFAGRVPHERLDPWYDQAAVVVAPHQWIEPFGRTVVEAMAHGSVVVASDIGGPAEVINDGVTGFLFQHNSTASLVTHLRQALTLGELERREISRAARRWVTDNLSPEMIAAQHESLYQQPLPT